MVTVEELHAVKPELAQQLIEPLWRTFDGVSNQVKGDLLHVFGEIGGRFVVPKIRAVLADALPEDVKEAAEEALGKIIEKSV
jgi:HEAT repeat protein